MAENDPNRIQLIPLDERVRVYWQATVIADTAAAVALDERGYPRRLYLPMADVATDALSVSETVTHCPYKGEATYYHVHRNGEQLDDAGWCYADPLADVEAIAGHVAFDHDALVIERGD